MKSVTITIILFVFISCDNKSHIVRRGNRTFSYVIDGVQYPAKVNDSMCYIGRMMVMTDTPLLIKKYQDTVYFVRTDSDSISACYRLLQLDTHNHYEGEMKFRYHSGKFNTHNGFEAEFERGSTSNIVSFRFYEGDSAVVHVDEFGREPSKRFKMYVFQGKKVLLKRVRKV